MKKSNKLVIAILVAVIVAGVFVFEKIQNRGGNANQKVIAIATLQTHPILDAVQKGVIDELTSDGYANGIGARYILLNAEGNMGQVAAIADELAARNPDVVVAISTPVAQAIVKKFKGEIVFGALTDPVGAGVVDSLDGSNPKVTGTTDAIPYGEQLKLIRRINPNAKRLGLLFNPGEASSQFAVKKIEEIAPTLGFEVVEGPVNSTSEEYRVAAGLVGRVDVLLISTDNTVAAGIAGALKAGIENKIPVFACDSGSVEKGAIGAVSAGYYEIGRETGKLVVKVLHGEKNLPVVKPESGQIYLNEKAAELMHDPLPPGVVTNATKVFDEIK